MRTLPGLLHRRGVMDNGTFINHGLGVKRWLYAGSERGEKLYYRITHTGQQLIVADSYLYHEAREVRRLAAARRRIGRVSRRLSEINSMKAVYGRTVAGMCAAPDIAACSIHDPLYRLYGGEWNALRSRLRGLMKRRKMICVG